MTVGAVATFYISKVISKKIHFFYLFFPIIILIGYFLITANVKYFDKRLPTECDVKAMVYRVKETGTGFMLFVRKNPFDHSRYIVYSKEYYSPGSLIEVTGRCEKIKKPTNPGEFDKATYYNSQKIIATIYPDDITLVKRIYNWQFYYAARLADKIDASFKSICEEKYAGVFSSILLGRKDELDNSLNDLFTVSGIGHILAISGLHISLIGMAIYKLIRRIKNNYLFAMIVSAMLIFFYGVLTGNGISTIRALIMFSVMVYANVVGKTYDIMSAAALSAIITLIDAPLLLFNSSFLLSYLAIVGLVYLFDSIKKMLKKANVLIQNLIASISIQLTTLPVTAYFFYKIPLLSIFLNLIVIPLMTILMISAMLAGIVGIFSKSIALFLVGPAVYIVKLYEKMCMINEKIQWSTFLVGRPHMYQIILYCVLLIGFIYIIRHYKKKTSSLILLVAVFVLIFRIRFYDEVIMLDVGQGDGIFIQAKDGTTILIDGGSSDKKNLYDYVLKPFLDSRAVKKIDYAIVTHWDNDHISGLCKLLDNNKIKELLIPDVNMVDEKLTELIEIAKNNKVRITSLHKGMYIDIGDLRAECIHPVSGYISEDRNDCSTTLYLHNKTFSMLLTGDISENVENEIIKQYQLGALDVLKSAHHGSRFSNSEEFLNAYLPHNTIISCGLNNSYGHPHQESIDRLNSINSKVFRTDYMGAIIIKIKTNSFELSTYL